MTRFARLNSFGMTLAATAMTLAACSSGQGTDEESGQIQQRIVCESQNCGPGKPVPIHLPPDLQTCTETETCWAWPGQYGFYDIAQGPIPGQPGWYGPTNEDFQTQMAAANCGQEFLYAPGVSPEDYVNSVYIKPLAAALCPVGTVVPPAVVVGVDAFYGVGTPLPSGCGCTGATIPAGWQLVTWMVDSPNWQPGGGCRQTGCGAAVPPGVLREADGGFAVADGAAH